MAAAKAKAKDVARTRGAVRIAPVGRPPEAEQREVREAILSAALRAFGDKGVEACSLQEIAALAGVTKPMVYYYFKSKAGLLRAVIEKVHVEAFDRLHVTARDEARTVRERVLLLARDHRERARRQPEVVRFMRRLFFSPPPRQLRPFDRRQFKQMLVSLYQSFHTMAEQGVRSGELCGEPRLVASTLHAVFAFSPMVELLFEDEPLARRSRLIEEMLESLWTGLAPARDEEISR